MAQRKPENDWSILVVDDDNEFREGLSDFLSEEGFKVRGVSDGQDALDQIERECPDLVLLDLQMPGMDGNEFLTRRAADARLRHIPIVVISASLKEEGNRDLARFATLEKPVDAAKLLKLVHFIRSWTIGRQKRMVS